MIKPLQSVLDQAHAGHVYVTDQDKHGIPEDWRPELIGDCDSFALWCRNRLREQGVEADLVFCRTETGAAHLVCSVGGWVLDNRHRWVMRRDDLEYEWLSLGTPAGTWLKITG